MTTEDKDPGPAFAVDFTLGDKTYSMRPTFDAIQRIEAALRMFVSEIAVCYDAEPPRVGFTMQTRILYEGIRTDAGNGAPSYEEVGRALVEGPGLADSVAPAYRLISAFMFGLEKMIENAHAGGGGGAAGAADEDPTSPQGPIPGDDS